MNYFHEVKVSMSFSAVEIKEYFCGGQYELQGRKKTLLSSPLTGRKKALCEILEMEVPRVSKIIDRITCLE